MQLRTPEENRFREQRRSALRSSGAVYGLDFVEVTRDQSPDRFRLRLHFLSAAPAGLTASHLVIRSPQGLLDSGLGVESVRRLQEAPGCDELTLRIHDPARAERLARDPSDYQLELVGLENVDPFFSAAPFRFDGEPGGAAALSHSVAAERPGQEFDYLAKDYASFRRLMLERLSARVPEWTERNAADLGVAIVEVLAYVADYLSYTQDAVATEAYLDTARRRSSVRRHLRLVGHHLHEGCNARVWTQIQIDRAAGKGAIEVPEGTRLLTRAAGLPAAIPFPSTDYDAAVAQGSLLFETLHRARLYPAHNRMALYAWGADDYTLPEGATSVALEGSFPDLKRGDVLILEAALPHAGGSEPRRHAARLCASPRPGRDPLTGQAITEVELFEQDALPFPLPVAVPTTEEPKRMKIRPREPNGYLAAGSVSATLDGVFPDLETGDVVIFERPLGPDEAAAVTIHEVSLSAPCRFELDPRDRRDVTVIEFEDHPFAARWPAQATTAVGPVHGRAVARGNILLADHGETIHEQLPEVPAGGRWEPVLGRTDLTRRVPYDHREARGGSAASALRQAPRLALPALELIPRRGQRQGNPPTSEAWRPRADLLDSHRFGRHVVVETESDGQARLRFGDGVLGYRPVAGARLEAVYRVGNGPGGSLGPGALAHVVVQGPMPISRVWNPMASEGGELPEPLDRARLVAPRAFRERKVSVTADDCAALAQSHPEVLSAAGRTVWTGSWSTVFVHVQRRDGRALDEDFERRLRRHLEGRLLADRDLEIRPPGTLAVEARLRGQVAAGFLRESVARKLLDALSDRRLADGALGFFHPDLFPLGRTLYLGQLLAAAMALPGIALIEADVFRPRGDPGPAVRDRVEPGPFEVVCLRNLPFSPELGTLTLDLEAV